jgi:RNA 2',3'-cyclic 3'-phosphodiesterase
LDNLTRSFIAIEISPEIQNTISSYWAALKLSSAGVLKPVMPSNRHLTLKFLGDVNSAQLLKIQQSLSGIIPLYKPMKITVVGFGVFASWKNPRVIWAGVQYPPELKELNDRIEISLAPLGIPPERRPFSPHLTLARVRDNPFPSYDFSELIHASRQNPIFGTMEVTGVSLFRSVLQREGPVYSRISTFNLSAN